MLGQSYDMMAQQRATPRWKEWIPLVSQQLRLRNLIQVIAYNVNINEKQFHRIHDSKAKKLKTDKIKSSFYYTLHLTTMSAPFYTSEKIESDNPKWVEMEITDIVNHVNASVTGMVVRLWAHRDSELQDQVVTVWGMYFSGLVYLGSRPCLDPATFCANTIVLHMQGGFFTALHCLWESTPRKRHTCVLISAADVRPSYTVNLLLRLHTIQQAIKKQMLAAESLREKISAGGMPASSESRESAVLRRLLNKSRPRAPQRQELLRARKEVEMTRFRVEMLMQERTRKQTELRSLDGARDTLAEANQDRGSELMSKYQALHKEMERLKEWRKNYVDTREAFLHTNAQLIFRRKQLISELNLIYPISQLSNSKYTICGVHLPNSEDFPGNEEVMISVALGFVAHVVQMISIFLQVPLRYPIIHFGSRSKIVDHVVEKIPEKDREFPLFSRGKDKLQFNYGVYLLNKNIAQLRWYCGLPTQDLRATLSNLSGLLHLRPGPNMLESHHRTLSGSSLDLRSSSQNPSPVGSLSTGIRRHPLDLRDSRHFEKGHRISKSMGSSDLQFQVKTVDPEVQSAIDFAVTDGRDGFPSDGAPVTTSLSYSLDKGLDEYEEIKKAEDTTRPATTISAQQSNLGHVGSEPILTPGLRDKSSVLDDLENVSSGDEARRRFLQSWQAGGPAPICSDDDLEVLQQSRTTATLYVTQDDGAEKQTLYLNSIALNNDTTAEQYSEPLLPDSIVNETELVTNVNNGNTFENTFITECTPEAVKGIILDSPHLQNDVKNGVCFPHETLLVSDNEPNSPNLAFARVDLKSVNSHTLRDNALHVKSIPNSPSNIRRETCERKLSVSNHSVSEELEEFEAPVSLEDITDLIQNSILVDNMFANVTSRTEALANRSGSFNMVRSRHGSMMEEGPS